MLHLQEGLALYKYAKTYYRGMGEPFIADVLREGLPEGTYVTGDPDLAKRYARVGASNILEGNNRHAVPSKARIKQLKFLGSLGMTPQEKHFLAPNPWKPSGGVIKIDIPDSLEDSLRLGGMGTHDEKVVRKRIPAKFITKVEGGAKPFQHAPPLVSSHLTKKHVRLLRAAQQRGLGDQAMKILRDNAPSSIPTWDTSSMDIGEDFARRIRKGRDGRKVLTGLLRNLLR